MVLFWKAQYVMHIRNLSCWVAHHRLDLTSDRLSSNRYIHLADESMAKMRHYSTWTHEKHMNNT